MEKRPLSGMKQSSFCPFSIFPERKNSSRMMKIEAAPVLPFWASRPSFAGKRVTPPRRLSQEFPGISPCGKISG
jgi:hypothetical protein